MNYQPEPYVEVMIDIETTGLEPSTSGIWQVGLVTSKGLAFKVTINPQGLPSETNTIKWQETANRDNWEDAQTINPEYSMQDMLVLLIEHILHIREKHSKLRFWSKGEFDFRHLSYHLKAQKIAVPWKYWELNDLRTLTNVFDIPKFSGGHSALRDARMQLDVLMTVLAKVEKVK